MRQKLYLEDSYLKELETKVKEVNQDKFIVLEQTIFYPNGGGQIHDIGVIEKDDHLFNIVYVGKFNDQISHEIDKPGLKKGDNVKIRIDWERRYKFMRSHTAAHIVSEIVHRKTKALITGNQLDLEKIRIDFSLENFDRELISSFIEEANKIVEQDLPIKTYFLSREEAEKIPQLSKLATGLPEEIKNVRIIQIGDFDTQADGGTHVKSTKEVGKIIFLKAENKGKERRRIYFSLE